MHGTTTSKSQLLDRVSGSAPGRVRSRRVLLIEYGLLFVVLPGAYALLRSPLHLPNIPTLWLLAGGCLVVLLNSPDFNRKRLWRLLDLTRCARLVVLPFLLAAPPLLAVTAFFFPEKLFAFVRERPTMWAAVMVLYPILSVYPQGIVYRAFIFHRYRGLFPNRLARILASAVAFALVHLIYMNWVAPVLSLLGGLLFAWTYARTRSALVATLQHAAFGCFLFTTGLGAYFH